MPAALAPDAGARVKRFVVSYAGAGHYATTYHSTPPNPGGNPDENTARDSSTQSWTVRFRSPLALPCAARRHAYTCASIAALRTAEGSTSATGKIDHVHIDGLFPADNVSEQCSVQAHTPAGARLPVTLSVAVLRRRAMLALQVTDPVSTVLVDLPSACPGQGDSIDGLLDNYFTPGFSFAPGYGPDRWFTSGRVLIPISRLERSRRLRIRLSQTRHGTPPGSCRVSNPGYEQCATGGAWAGVLTLSLTR